MIHDSYELPTTSYAWWCPTCRLYRGFSGEQPECSDCEAVLLWVPDIERERQRAESFFRSWSEVRDELARARLELSAAQTPAGIDRGRVEEATAEVPALRASRDHYKAESERLSQVARELRDQLAASQAEVERGMGIAQGLQIGYQVQLAAAQARIAELESRS